MVVEDALKHLQGPERLEQGSRPELLSRRTPSDDRRFPGPGRLDALVYKHAVAEAVEVRVVEDLVPAVIATDDKVPHAVPGPYDVVAGAARDLVVAQATHYLVVATAALDPVVAPPAQDLVVAALAVEVVGSRSAAHEVVAVPGEYGVVPVRAEYGVGPVRAGAKPSIAPDRRRHSHPAAHDDRQRDRREQDRRSPHLRTSFSLWRGHPPLI